MKRGFYTILTTFFFIIITLIVTLGVIYYGSAMANINHKVSSGLNKYVVARNLRDSVYFCYGKVLDEQRLDSGRCRVTNQSLQVTQDMIQGYRVRKIGINNCTAKEWSDVNITTIKGSYDDRIIYAVPILEDGLNVCMGFMEVYI